MPVSGRTGGKASPALTMHGESYAPLITDAQIEAMRPGPVSWRNAVETPTVPEG